MSLHSYLHVWLHGVWWTIAQQEEHHRMRRFSKELRRFVERCGLQWHKEEETVENSFIGSGSDGHRL